MMYESVTSHIVAIDIPDGILSRKMSDKLLGYLNQRYTNKCLDNYLVLRVRRVTRQSMFLFNARNRIMHSIEFEADTLFYHSGDILSCNIIYANKCILGQKRGSSGSDVTFTVQFHDAFKGLGLGDVIPVKTVTTLCSERGLIVQAVMLTEMDIFTTTFMVTAEATQKMPELIAVDPKKEGVLSMFMRLFKKGLEQKKPVPLAPSAKTILFDSVIDGKIYCGSAAPVKTSVVRLSYDNIVNKIATDYNKLVYMVNNTEFNDNVLLLYDNQ